jgi:hypothetical protein
MFEQKGIPVELLLGNAVFPPACGMGPLPQKDAEGVLRLTASLARQIENKYAGV